MLGRDESRTGPNHAFTSDRRPRRFQVTPAPRASRYSAWRWRRLADGGPCRATLRGTPRGVANPGAIRPVFGCRNPGSGLFPNRVPVRPPASKPGSSCPPKAQADARCGPKTGGEWRRGRPENLVMKDRRRRGRAVPVRFRSGAADSSAGPKLPGFRRAKPRIIKACRNHPSFGFSSRPNPGIGCHRPNVQVNRTRRTARMKPSNPAAGSG
jgi:hypothetical protein